QLYWENYVYVAHPSGNDRIDQLWSPDVLIPVALRSQQSVESHRSIVVWVAIHAPADATPEDYYGAIDITANGEPHQLAVALTVEHITMPAPTLRGNVAVYYNVL